MLTLYLINQKTQIQQPWFLMQLIPQKKEFDLLLVDTAGD